MVGGVGVSGLTVWIVSFVVKEFGLETIARFRCCVDWSCTAYLLFFVGLICMLSSFVDTNSSCG
jgi:hypothetical protein